ncbi:hypothetical protein KDA11_03965, partial [Candidatus Saccharibacteria bacterium]|nr:hypothetical protein [Candidatus Saccharibacteria bacterium]
MERSNAMRPNTVIHALFQQCGCTRCPDAIYRLMEQRLPQHEFKPRLFLAINLLTIASGLPSDDIWEMFLYLFCLNHHNVLADIGEQSKAEKFQQIDTGNLADTSPFVQYVNAAVRLERLNISHV